MAGDPGGCSAHISSSARQADGSPPQPAAYGARPPLAMGCPPPPARIESPYGDRVGPLLDAGTGFDAGHSFL